MAVKVFAIILFVLLFIYCFVFTRYFLALRASIKSNSSQDGKPVLSVSVIIPFRNEINNLKSLVEELFNQSYPKDLFEVVFVDDFSDDGSTQLLEKMCMGVENFRLISEARGLGGKKNAIHKGIKNSTGKWIIQSDADCSIPEDYIALHAGMAAKGLYSLIGGPVRIQTQARLWDMIESLEFMSLLGVGMASFSQGNPVMCNGANLSYSREFYSEVEEELLSIPSPSGDDIFLLSAAKKRKRQVGFLFSREAIVNTKPAGDLISFFRQRVRWGSKSRYYTDKDMIFLSFLVWLVNTFITLGLIAAVFNLSPFWIFLISLILKSAVDFLILHSMAGFLEQKAHLWAFPISAIFYYFYITLAGVFSMFSIFRWKGRRYAGSY